MDCGPQRCRCRVKTGKRRGRATFWRHFCAPFLKSPEALVMDEVGDLSTRLSSSIFQGSLLVAT